MAQSSLKNMSQEVRNIPEVGYVDVYSVEGSAGHVEFVAQAHINIGDLAIGGLAARPLCQCLEQLLRSDKEMGDTLFDLRQG